MTAKILIEAIIKDFESFFINEYKIKIEHNPYAHALVIKGDSTETRIVIPEPFSDMIIDKEEDKFYTLFLLGHEIAHYMNKHNNHQDNSSIDSLSIEMWADFFGSIISMTVLKFGKHFSSYLNCNLNNRDETLKYIFFSFERLYEVYKGSDNSSKYPNSNDRLRTLFTGVLSFLVRVDMILNKKNISLNELYLKSSSNWFITIFRLLDKKSNLYRILGTSNELDKQEIHQRTKEIHEQLMGDKNQITEGLNPLLQWIIGTDFNRPDYMNKARERLKIK